MNLHIFKETQGRIPKKRLQRLFRKLSQEEKKPGWKGSVNLVFIDDKKMKQLNRQYRRIDKPTDVLAFLIDHPISKDSLLGEVYVSIPTANRQAKEDGRPVTEELVVLSCHGLLHLFGYDHMRKRDAEQMKALEDYFVTHSRRDSDD